MFVWHGRARRLCRFSTTLPSDAIITDQKMPNMTGIEFLEAFTEEVSEHRPDCAYRLCRCGRSYCRHQYRQGPEIHHKAFLGSRMIFGLRSRMLWKKWSSCGRTIGLPQSLSWQMKNSGPKTLSFARRLRNRFFPRGLFMAVRKWESILHLLRRVTGTETVLSSFKVKPEPARNSWPASFMAKATAATRFLFRLTAAPFPKNPGA